MKDFIAKLKSAGFKKLAVDHGEKAVAFLIGMLLLFSLWGTNWASYEKTPEELTRKVQSASTAISQGDWANSASFSRSGPPDYFSILKRSDSAEPSVIRIGKSVILICVPSLICPLKGCQDALYRERDTSGISFIRDRHHVHPALENLVRINNKSIAAVDNS